MKSRLLTFAVATVAVTTASAQTFARRADIRGGPGGSDSGKCTVEVVVDGAAQVEIRGSDAVLRNLKGGAPQWRRFECTGVMPRNPGNFRFQGVDGRGSQRLTSDPRNGGVAVVQIDDPDNGSEGYTFDIFWGNSGGSVPQSPGPQNPVTQNSGRPDFDRFGRGNVSGRFGTDQAVQVCQDAVRQETAQRFRTNDVNFRRTAIDDNPGRGDWVVGTLEARHPGRPDEILKFSCSVDFQSGRVRSAQVEPFYSEGGGQGPGSGAGGSAIAIQNCQRSVQDKVRRDGFDRVNFGSVRVDDQPGRSDWIIGDFRAVGQYGPESFRFSCSVNLRDGDVRSVDVTTEQQGGRPPAGNVTATAIQNCQRSVQERLNRDGYDRANFGSVRIDDQPGRSDWVVGDLRAAGRYGPESLHFSCSVDLHDGNVRSVDINTRTR